MSNGRYSREFSSRIRSGKRSNCFDLSGIDQNEDPFQNLVKIFSTFCQEDVFVDNQTHISYFNVLVNLADKLQQDNAKQIVYLSIFSIVKYSLWSDCRLIRTAAIRCLRHFLRASQHVRWFLAMRLDFMLMRSMELSYEDAINCKYRSNEDIERSQCLRLLYKLSLLNPSLFPHTLIFMLCGVCEAAADRSSSGGTVDIAFRPALMILSQLVVAQPGLSFCNGPLTALQTVICTNNEGKIPQLNHRITEAVLLSLLKLTTQLPWRKSIPSGFFQKTISPFSIFSMDHICNSKQDQTFRSFNDELADSEVTAINVVSSLLQSWSGLLYMCSSSNEPIKTLLQMLDVGSTAVRNRCLDLIYRLLELVRPAADCTDLQSCVLSLAEQLGPRSSPHWGLDSEFLVGHAADTLPYLSASRLNLVDNFQALLLAVLVHYGLLEAVASAVADPAEATSARACMLLACLLYKCSVLLPAEHAELGLRVEPSRLLGDDRCRKSLHWSLRVRELLQTGLSPGAAAAASPFLGALLRQNPANCGAELSETTLAADETKTESGGEQASGLSAGKRYLRPPNLEEMLDSGFHLVPPTASSGTFSRRGGGQLQDGGRHGLKVAGLLDHVSRYSRVLESSSSSSTPGAAAADKTAFYDAWDWDLLLAFSNCLPYTGRAGLPSGVDGVLLFRVVRVLLKFLVGFESTRENASSHITDPASTHCFLSLPLSWRHSNKAAFVLTDLVAFLAEYAKTTSTEPEELLWILLFSDAIWEALYAQQLLEKKKYELTGRCVSLLFLAVGRLTATEAGDTFLERAGIVPLFQKVLQQRGSLLSVAKLVLAGLDYTRPALGRALLTMAATGPSVHLRRYVARFMRVLLRCQVPFFGNWGITILIMLLCDSDVRVSEIAISVLLEACEDESVINNLRFESLNILGKGFMGHLLFSRLLSVPYHFEQLMQKDSVHFFLESWKKQYNKEYCRHVDRLLLDRFSSYDDSRQRQSRSGSGQERDGEEDDEEEEARVSGVIRRQSTELILPCHPFAALAEHRDGLEELLGRGELQEPMLLISSCWRRLHGEYCCPADNDDWSADQTSSHLEQDEDDLGLRSAMLAVAHVASTMWGVEWAHDTGLPLQLSDITRLHPSLDVRGTGLVCLGLLGSSRRGASLLQQGGLWVACRTDRRCQWPPLLELRLEWHQSRAEVRRHLASESSHSATEPAATSSATSVGCSVFAAANRDHDDGSGDENESEGCYQKLPSNASLASGRAPVIRKVSAPCKPCSLDNGKLQLPGPPRLPHQNHHRRDASLGAVSGLTQLSSCSSSGLGGGGDGVSSGVTQTGFISPHDLMGLAAVRRLQKKIRSKISMAQRRLSQPLEMSIRQDVQMNQNFSSLQLSRINRITNNDEEGSGNRNRRSKFSSVVSPRGHLSKYRGIVLPNKMAVFLTDLSTSLGVSQEAVRGHGYEPRSCGSITMATTAANGLSDSVTKSRAVSDVSTVATAERSMKLGSATGVGVIDERDPTMMASTSGYVSLDGTTGSSLTAALFELDSIVLEEARKEAETEMTGVKDQRSSSNQEPGSPSFNAVRPRAVTIATLISHDTGFGESDICRHKDIAALLHGLTPPRHQPHHGLCLHRSDLCLNFFCGQPNQPPLSPDAAEFRQKVIQAAYGMLSLGPRSRRLELGLAQLRSHKPLLWGDPCLFTELSILFTTASFSRQARIFLHDLFIGITFPQMRDEMKLLLGQLSSEYNVRCSFSTRL